ncbi:MAG: PilT/PilU family type 4a pilus ATPase [Acidobacteriota bacterium]
MESVTLDDARRNDVVAALGKCPLFRALKAEHFPQIINIGELYQYDPEEVIIRQGDPSDSFFVIVDGEVSVRDAKPDGEYIELGRMPAKSSVGEIGLLLDEPRTATVVATQQAVVLKFGAKAFHVMFQKIPDFGVGVSRGLAHRLEQVSGRRVALPEYDTTKPRPPVDVLSLLPRELCQRHRILPLQVDGSIVTMGFVDEPSTQVMTAVRDQLASMDIRPMHINLEFYNKIMQSYVGLEGWGAPAEAAPEAPPAARPQSKSPRLDGLLERVVAEGASDLHVSAGHKPHWRIEGDMQTIVDLPVLGENEVFELLQPVMEHRHLDEFAERMDADFAYAVPGLARFRVNMYKDNHGVGAAFRLIPSKVLTLDQLGLPAVLKNFCEVPKGLILVTGPTGCGKSTTLAAMIDHIIKTRKAHIVTLEDPIEFVHQSDACLINQREIGGQVQSFGRGLRAALREDPDIVLLGEMRDAETIALALETANTGHLVLATLHTNTAITALDRIIDSFPGDQQPQIQSTLGDVLRGVVAQMLVKKIGGGRMAVCEVMVVNYAIQNLVREKKTQQIPSVMQTARGIGMALLNDELAKLVEDRKIEMQEAMSKAIDKDDLNRRFRSGLTLAEDPPTFERVRIIAVRPSTPASEAGLHRGDYIVEFAGKPTKEYTVDEIRAAFRIDMQHQLGIQRGDKRLKIVMDMRK